MTVLDTSALIDYLLGGGAADQVQRLFDDEGELAAPDLIVFETLAVFRREALRGTLPEQRLAGAIADLGDVPIELFPSLSLRERAWQLRHNLTIADALFLALAESLQESLATKDAALAAAAEQHASVRALRLS
ncbi:MAG TPA: type II toxin-antitoxin system VapC family toxin [Solirubrobacteraceae bacterium]|nr:type II toxin-antitoxin system VapC family toxin [Solirubrobacteraceae bacterium]